MKEKSLELGPDWTLRRKPDIWKKYKMAYRMKLHGHKEMPEGEIWFDETLNDTEIDRILSWIGLPTLDQLYREGLYKGFQDHMGRGRKNPGKRVRLPNAYNDVAETMRYMWRYFRALEIAFEVAHRKWSRNQTLPENVLTAGKVKALTHNRISIIPPQYIYPMWYTWRELLERLRNFSPSKAEAHDEIGAIKASVEARFKSLAKLMNADKFMHEGFEVKSENFIPVVAIPEFELEMIVWFLGTDTQYPGVYVAEPNRRGLLQRAKLKKISKSARHPDMTIETELANLPEVTLKPWDIAPEFTDMELAPGKFDKPGCYEHQLMIITGDDYAKLLGALRDSWFAIHGPNETIDAALRPGQPQPAPAPAPPAPEPAPAPEPEGPPEGLHRPTVGDRVRVTKSGNTWPTVGDEGKIITDDHSSMPWRIEWTGGNTRWHYESKWWEYIVVITPAPEPAPAPAPPEMIMDLPRVGSQVTSKGYLKGHTPKKGTQGIVVEINPVAGGDVHVWVRWFSSRGKYTHWVRDPWRKYIDDGSTPPETPEGEPGEAPEGEPGEAPEPAPGEAEPVEAPEGEVEAPTPEPPAVEPPAAPFPFPPFTEPVVGSIAETMDGRKGRVIAIKPPATPGGEPIIDIEEIQSNPRRRKKKKGRRHR